MNQSRYGEVKIPPWDLRSEQALLGSILLEPDAVERLVPQLDEGQFYKEVHQTIFRAIRACYDRREPVQIITVRLELDRMGVLEECGGFEYLMALLGDVPAAAQAQFHAKTVKDTARLRHLISLCVDAEEAAYDNPADVQGLLTELQGKLGDLVEEGVVGQQAPQSVGQMTDLCDKMWEWIDEAMSKDARPHFNLPSLDTYLGGCQVPGLTTLMGDSSTGKTELALQCTLDWTLHHKQQTCYFSTEMNREQLLVRMARLMRGIDLSPRGLSLGDEASIRQEALGAMNDLKACPELILACGSYSIGDIEAEAVALSRQGVRFFIVDYFQDLVPEQARHENQTIMYASWVQRLKHLAKRTGSGILVLSQVTRLAGSSEVRAYGSEQLESTSHCILRIEREGATREEKRRSKKAQIIIRKSRMGPVGKPFEVEVCDRGFVELTTQTPPGPQADMEDARYGTPGQ